MASVTVVLCWILGCFLTAALMYLYVLAAAAFLRPPPGRGPLPKPTTRFAVVIPAHNEEESLPCLLDSLRRLGYPEFLYRVYVVADNCTDRTASMARDRGVRVLERNDPDRCGKGYALQFGFARAVEEGCDAVFVTDADTRVDPMTLRILDARLQDGEQVIQTYNGPANPDASPLSYFLAVGNHIENDFFLDGKRALGLPVALGGLGMCISSSVLGRFPWKAYSITEDLEYTLTLAREGVTVRYDPQIRTHSELPIRGGQAHGQRLRWAAGSSGSWLIRAAALMARGLVIGRGSIVDLGWSLLVRSKSGLLMAGMVFCGLSCLHQALGGGRGLIIWSVACLGALGAYFTLGVITFGLTPRRLRWLLASPAYLVWLLSVALLALVGFKPGQWTRTPRGGGSCDA